MKDHKMGWWAPENRELGKLNLIDENV